MNKKKMNFNNFADKDGLFSVNDLRFDMDINGNYTFWFHKALPNQVFYPSPHIKPILSMLLEEKTNLNVSIKVVSSELGLKRICIYGVPFESVVTKALHNGETIKSRFTLTNPESYEGVGLVTDLIVHVTSFIINRERRLTVNSWTPLGDDGEVFYIHAHYWPDRQLFSHLDGAVIRFLPEEVKSLVDKGLKIKGQAYEKQFRMDGSITAKEAYQVVRLFLPGEEIVDEYFEQKM